MATKPKPKFEPQDSVVMLDYRNESTAGSQPTTTPRPMSPLSDFSKHQSPTAAAPSAFETPPPTAVALTIRRGRALWITVVAVAVIFGIVFMLVQGMEISRFENASKNSTVREKLLDDYNSYTGNVASAFGKPIEFVVTALVQIITLRFMALSFTRPTTHWKTGTITLVAGAAVGYLISNAFNALNVQLRPQDVQAVISASDLSQNPQLSSLISARTTTVTNSVSELSPGNLITNTVLRNAVLPRVTLKQDLCDWKETKSPASFGRTHEKEVPAISYGFTQYDWQSRVLQEALTPQSLRVVVNATDKTANQNVKPENLPMNATLAADLFLYAMSVAPKLFPWGSIQDYMAITERQKVNEAMRDPTARPQGPSARILGFLPPSPSSDETTQREWFLRESQAAVSRQFNDSINTSRSDIVMTFSHVDVSPQITFDAVTLDVDMTPSLLATAGASDDATRYTTVIQATSPGREQDCGPWPALCLVKAQPYRPSYSNLWDPLQQVHAFAACASATGSDQLQFGPNDWIDCSRTSNSSMMVYSVGKRLVADAIEEKVSTLPSGPVGRITNLRKVYTFTMGRLAWRFSDLSEAFNAKCDAGVSCTGLQLPLSSKSLREASSTRETPTRQHLVVGADALTTNVLIASQLEHRDSLRSVSLVEVSEPLTPSYVSAGDVLLPHNSAKVVWENRTVSDKICNADIEAVLFDKLNNHMYIEHGFQTAYTAATFFLLQNGVVKDTVPLSGNKTTLKFDRNTQDVVVWMSTPKQNAYLSIAGCTLLVLGVLGALFKAVRDASAQDGDPLTKISAPQAIARVMLDDKQFPPMLLDRRVVDASDAQVQHRVLDEFAISEITVQHAEKRDRLTAMDQ